MSKVGIAQRGLLSDEVAPVENFLSAEFDDDVVLRGALGPSGARYPS